MQNMSFEDIVIIKMLSEHPKVGLWALPHRSPQEHLNDGNHGPIVCEMHPVGSAKWLGKSEPSGIN